MDKCICGSDDGLHIKECPMWKNSFQEINDLISTQQREIDMLHAENALKLTQILGLEQLLYEVRILDEDDGSPCWCAGTGSGPDGILHSFSCVEARKAAEPFWKK